MRDIEFKTLPIVRQALYRRWDLGAREESIRGRPPARLRTGQTNRV
jgi:hypothetical protein